MVVTNILKQHCLHLQGQSRWARMWLGYACKLQSRYQIRPHDRKWSEPILVWKHRVNIPLQTSRHWWQEHTNPSSIIPLEQYCVVQLAFTAWNGQQPFNVAVFCCIRTRGGEKYPTEIWCGSVNNNWTGLWQGTPADFCTHSDEYSRSKQTNNI